MELDFERDVSEYAAARCSTVEAAIDMAFEMAAAEADGKKKKEKSTSKRNTQPGKKKNHRLR